MKQSSQEWFEKKELSAGEKRLKLSWWIYNHFGTIPLKMIAFVITLFTVLTQKELRNNSHKYFRYLYEYTQNKMYKPSFKNIFLHSLNYAFSLIDKMLVYSDNFKNIYFKNVETKNTILNFIQNKQGAFFVSNHIGNINMLRAFISKNDIPPVKINVFLQKNQCEIFNNFINKISTQENIIELFPVEDIDIDTSIIIQDKINNGEFVFMAGDRISATTKEMSYSAELLNHSILLPLGVLKFSIMLNCPILFSTCAKKDNSYYFSIQKIELSGSKSKKIEILKTLFPKFLELSTLEYPYQFFNFYNIFKD